MITTPIVSQRDSRWAWKSLGFSAGTIGDFGCVISCLTMLARETDVSRVNDLMKQFGNYYNGNYASPFADNLVVWGNVPNALKNLKFVERGWSYNNDKVKAHIAKGFPVVVQVDAGPIGSPRTDHYVLFVGDQKLVDPWTGRIRPTSDFPQVKGYALYTVTSVDPYAEKLKTLKVAVDRLKVEFDADFSSPNKEQVYKNTLNKIKKIYDTGSL